MLTESPIDLESLRQAAESACRLMKVLSNRDRLLLLCQLSQGEKRVGELEELVGVSQPTLSQQLGVLREEGLVTTRRDGKNIYYEIASPQALAVMNVLFSPPTSRIPYKSIPYRRSVKVRQLSATCRTLRTTACRL